MGKKRDELVRKLQEGGVPPAAAISLLQEVEDERRQETRMESVRNYAVEDLMVIAARVTLRYVYGEATWFGFDGMSVKFNLRLTDSEVCVYPFNFSNLNGLSFRGIRVALEKNCDDTLRRSLKAALGLNWRQMELIVNLDNMISRAIGPALERYLEWVGW
jgi:hypothetical protein